MNEFIERNGRLFRFYSSAARLIGWSILLVALCFIFTGGGFSTRGIKEGSFPARIYSTGRMLFDYLLPALLMLLISQLIRYIAEPKYHRGWLLRYGGNILYISAFLVVSSTLWQHIYWFEILGVNSGPKLLWFFSVCPALAKVLILVGVGQILKRIMPIIEEHKSLV